MTPHKWDAFISHASEDKDGFVRPLSCALSDLGARIWFDEFTLRLGDSLSHSIDKGLSNSRFGIVVLSPAFMNKAWPEYELRGLIAREIQARSILILPVWHGVDHDQVLEFSPSLADKFAVKTISASAQEIALQILSIIRPDIYASHPHAELQRLASGQHVQDLQAELLHVRAQLAEFQCPFCQSALVGSQEVPLDHEERDWGSLLSFECGYVELDGGLQRPCPSDANFPKLDDYDIQYQEHPSEKVGYFHWTCSAFPKTVMAQLTPFRNANKPQGITGQLDTTSIH